MTVATPRMPLVLAFDIGTSSVRSALFDARGRRVEKSFAQESYRVDYTADGGAQLDPFTVQRAVHRCLAATLPRSDASRVLAVGVFCFWHSLLGLDAKGQPATPIYTWADSRCRQEAARLREQMSERRYHARTGCMLRTSYRPAKLRWLRRARVAKWVSPADWIFSAPHTSISMASGTGLLDIAKMRWIEDVGVLPVLDEPFVWRGLRMFPAIGDGAAGNLGSGRAAINYGTMATVRVLSRATKAPFGLFCYRVDARRTVIGGAVSNAGNLFAWCANELQYSRLPTAQSSALTVLPFWVSERAPTWPEDLRGVIAGLTLATTGGDISRAAQDAVFHRLASIARKLPARKFVVSGGITRSPVELQRLADVLGCELTICSEPEASLRGAAVFALEKLGFDVSPVRPGRTVRPRRPLTKLHAAARRRQEALECKLSS